MTMYRVSMRDPREPRVLTIERPWFSELFADMWGLYQEGFRLMGEPVPVSIPEEATA